MPVTVRQWHDATSWNDFVSRVPHTHFQQSWEWGELAPFLGGRAVRLAAIRDGAMVGAMQLFVNPVRGLNRTQLYVPRGPAVGEPCLALLGPLFDAARRLGVEHRALGIKVEPNAPASSCLWTENLEALNFRPSFPPSQPRSSWMLDITPDEDSLLADMKQKTRYNIRLAARKGVEVESATVADLDTFYALYRETAARDDFFIQPKSFYQAMFERFEAAGNFQMLFARYGGSVLAVVTLLRFGNTCWYVHGASSNEHRNLMAPYLLQWEAIRWAKDGGCTLYDFRAVPDLLREDQDMYGVYRFKEGFGGYQFTTTHTYAQPYRPVLFDMAQLYFSGRFALTQLQRKRQGLPVRQFA